MKKITVPGSKSISNRVLLLSALSPTPVQLENCLVSDDTVHMQKVLTAFGVKFKRISNHILEVSGADFSVDNTTEDLFIGNSGTSARFLACLSLLLKPNASFSLTGNAYMQKRPQSDLFKALREFGLSVDSKFKNDCLPANFTGKKEISQKHITISGKVSSQFLTGLLLVAPHMEAGLSIKVSGAIPSWPYIEMTLEILKIWGVKVTVNTAKTHFKVEPGITAPKHYKIPSDMSSASYPIAWSLLKKKPLCITNFGSKTLQGDEQFLSVAQKAGAIIHRIGESLTIQPPTTIKPLGTIDWSTMPDVSMTGMILASFADGLSVFEGLESLRVKECDRIKAMAQLKDLGVDYRINHNTVTIIGKSPTEAAIIKPVTIDAFDDHRIAMCFGLYRSTLGFGTDPFEMSPIKLKDSACVSKTWPDFWLSLADWEDQLRPVSAIIVKKNEKYLIVKKPRDRFAWQFVQGGVDTGESALQGAKRELMEECGADLSVKFKGEKPRGTYAYFFPKDFKRHNPHIIGAKVSFFEAEYLSGSVDVDGQEIIDSKWVDYEDLTDYFEPTYWQSIHDFC